MSADPTAIPLQMNPELRMMRGIAVHGDTPFEAPYMSKIAYNLYQGGCADGLRLPGHIEHLVSLYPWESYDVHQELKSALTVVMYDSANQQFEQVTAIARWVNNCREQGPTLVHCQAGLNRSSLVVVTALTLSGMTAREAIDLIREKRSPACLCNEAFERWLLR